MTTTTGKRPPAICWLSGGGHPNRDKGLEGLSIGGWTEVSQSLAASPRPGLAEVQAWVRPLGALPRRGGRLGCGVSCLSQCPPARPGVGLSASLLSLQTVGLGSAAGPDAAVSLSAPGWQRGQACCRLRALREPEPEPCSSVCKPVNPSPAGLDFLVPIGPDTRRIPRPCFWARLPESLPWRGHTCPCGKRHQRSRLLGSFRT